MRSGIYASIIVMVFLCAPALAYDWSTNPGDGSPDNPYQISQPNHLIAIGANPALLDKHFILTNDIIFDPNNNPAHVFSGSVIPTFQGTFDGNSKTIKNLTFSIPATSSEPYNGLFGELIYGEVRNLALDHASINIEGDKSYIGFINGLNRTGYIHHCSVNGTINGTTYSRVGGICGYNYGTIARCQSSGTFTATDTMGVVGGVCGAQEGGIISSCQSSVNLNADYLCRYVGGLCGSSIDAYSGKSVIYNSSAFGDIRSQEQIHYVGGFCGWNDHSDIIMCHSTGTVQCGPKVNNDWGYEYSGGFCGVNDVGAIRNCFSKSNIHCGPYSPDVTREQWIGGFCGSNNNGTIENCFSSGSLITDAAVKAGFCYYNKSDIRNCFWDTTKSAITTGIASGTVLTGATGLVTEQLQDINTFLAAGWDFVDETINGQDNIWKIEDGNFPEFNFPAFSGGEGSVNNPFKIGTADDLITLGKSPGLYCDYYVLMNSIDLTGYIFDEALIAPAQGNLVSYSGTPFCGTFNGCAFSIDNLTIQSSENKSFIGLFGLIGSGGVIKNLALNDIGIVYPSDSGLLGGICGLNMGSILRCSVNGSILGGVGIGGICGVNYSLIRHCYAVCDLQAYLSSVGGICGSNDQNYNRPSVPVVVDHCYAACSISSFYDFSAGGLLGSFKDGNLTNCFWDVDVSGKSYPFGYTRIGDLVENVEGYNTFEMRQQASYISWDFVGESADGENEIWRMCVDGVDYPRLSWEFGRNGDFACGSGVDLADLEALARAWLTAASLTPDTFNRAADANGDGRIDGADFVVLSDNWP